MTSKTIFADSRAINQCNFHAALRGVLIFLGLRPKQNVSAAPLFLTFSTSVS
jgi:hypothetical protein